MKLRLIALVVAVAALAACSAVQFSYNNMDGLIRYMVWDYVDLDAAQSENLQQRITRLHDWHRASELPAYVEMLRSASGRVARGVTSADVQWGIETLRARYRRATARGAEEAAPILVTLSKDQIASVEKKLAKEDAKYVKEWLSGSPSKRERHATERMIQRFEHWTGDLTAEQQARIREFVRAHPRNAEVRLEERRRWQRKAVELVKQYKNADELGRRLRRLFGEPDAERAQDYMIETRRWEGDLAQLITELDRTLSAEQRSRVIRRMDRYAEDFRTLAQDTGTAAQPFPAAAGS